MDPDDKSSAHGELIGAAGLSGYRAQVEDMYVTVPVSIETSDGRLIGNFFDQPLDPADEEGYTTVPLRVEKASGDEERPSQAAIAPGTGRNLPTAPSCMTFMPNK